jgi:hypothetical protein
MKTDVINAYYKNDIYTYILYFLFFHIQNILPVCGISDNTKKSFKSSLRNYHVLCVSYSTEEFMSFCFYKNI